MIGMVGLAKAQKPDTLQNASIRKIYDLIKIKGKPLIVIDGIIYSVKDKPFDTKDISALEVLHPPGSVNIYGMQAADGAILITTANLDKTNYSGEKSGSTVWVLDGEISTENEIKKLNPKDIFSVDVLKKGKMVDPSLGDMKSDIVVVLTKAAAIKTYQNKLSQFSKEYAAFLEVNNYDDSGISYINAANGELWRQSTKEGINLLYKLSVDDILKVKFSPRSENAAGWIPAILSITTKQN
jgi:hypothetical protein